MKVVRYKHDLPFSYALGMTLVIELLETRPRDAMEIFVHSDAVPNDNLQRLHNLADNAAIPVSINDKAFNLLSQKHNCFVIAAFRKFTDSPRPSAPHIVLVNPSDTGNVGTILRTAVGFDLADVAIVRPAVDIFDPKAVRASMGATFHARCRYYDTFEEYQDATGPRHLYAFMVHNAQSLPGTTCHAPYSLIFGNEAAGLPADFARIAQPVFIPQSHLIDSFSLPVAAALAMYWATQRSDPPS